MEEQQSLSRMQEFTGHMKQAGKSVLKQWGSLIPKEFWAYGQDATREMLLAMRTAVDGAINAIDPESENVPKSAEATKKTRSKRKIDIEG